MSHTPEHTSEPWKWYWRTNDEGNADCGIYSEVREGQAYSVCRAPRFQTHEKWEADARRIVACVNALAGIPTESLEKMSMVSMPRELVEQRDQLAADNAILRASLQTHAEKAAKLIGQRDNLHAIICQCLDALDNGAGATEECSIEFLSDAPAEIGLVVSRLKRQRDELLAALQLALPYIDKKAINADMAKSRPISECYVNSIVRAAITNATINISKTDSN